MSPHAGHCLGNETRERAVEFALTLNTNPKRQRGNHSTPSLALRDSGASGRGQHIRLTGNGRYWIRTSDFDRVRIAL